MRKGFVALLTRLIFDVFPVAVSAFVMSAFGMWSAPAGAQDMEFGLDETEQAPEGEMTFGEEEEEEASPAAEGDVIGNLAGADEAQQTETTAASAEEGAQEAREEIYAVQRIYALRINRVEINPSVSFSLNDPFVSHTGVGVGLNYWWTNVLALGVNFIWYEGLESESDIGFFVRRSTRLAVPVNSYQLGAHLAFTYVPIYGKFAMFNEFIFQYDIYVLGGVGLMRTRPIPVIDPEFRSFNYDFRVAFNVGIGLRVFVTRWLAIFGELRNYMYLEQLENLEVALGPDRADQATWSQSSPAFINNVTAHIGLTIFLPFDFEYRLPR